jgi:hypothetical protein
MNARCSRCDWRPTDDPDVGHREQLAFHAAESNHPLCICCSRSLQKFENGFTCDGCLNDARVLLAGIVTMWQELPQHLGHLRSPSYDRDRPGASDGRPLLGGDLLAMMAKGSRGDAEDGHSTKDGDPLSVSYELGWWAMEWQELRGDREPLRTVAQIAGYLETRARWAATSHPAFDAYLRDLRDLHGMLERATQRHRAAERANSECFDCNGTLIRKVGADGLADEHVTCGTCRRKYSPAEYLLAQADTITTARESLGWVTVAAGSFAAQRSTKVIRAWIEQGKIPCRPDHTGLGVTQVWYPSVHALNTTTARRRRGA